MRPLRAAARFIPYGVRAAAATVTQFPVLSVIQSFGHGWDEVSFSFCNVNEFRLVQSTFFEDVSNEITTLR